MVRWSVRLRRERRGTMRDSMVAVVVWIESLQPLLAADRSGEFMCMDE